MNTIEHYERDSDQKVNKEKSFFMVTPNTSHGIIEDIKMITGYGKKNSLIKYLGCPLYIGGQRIIYYTDIVEKVIKKVTGWQSKVLNFGGKITLVKHVLQSIPIHILAAISPPKTTINYIKRVIADFFWGIDKDRKKYHWASWENMAYSTIEGGIGIRLLDDICVYFQYKQWWELRTKQSLLSIFIKAKYCQRANILAKKYDTGNSIVWRYLTRIRKDVESHIKWQIQSCTCSFWWDNWIGEGPLAIHGVNISSLNNIVLLKFIVNGNWNERLIRQHVNPLIVPKILQTNINFDEGNADKAIWTPNENGLFTIASAWDIIRKKRHQDPINHIIWHRNIPFKVCFFIWRALKEKLPTNEILQKFDKNENDCYCCYNKGKDDINHILVTSHFAMYIWRYHAAKVGAILSNTNLRNQLLQWRNLHTHNQVYKLFIHIIPNFICWNLWKNRCAVKMEEKNQAFQESNMVSLKTLCKLLKVYSLVYHGNTIGIVCYILLINVNNSRKLLC